jgi:hypothetical protein
MAFVLTPSLSMILALDAAPSLRNGPSKVESSKSVYDAPPD